MTEGHEGYTSLLGHPLGRFFPKEKNNPVPLNCEVSKEVY